MQQIVLMGHCATSCLLKLSSVVHRNTEFSVRSRKQKTGQDGRQGGMSDKKGGKG